MRKSLYLLIVASLLLASCTSHVPTSIELTGWQFDYGGKEYPATVPGFIHTDLMANGIIPDPYYGTNEDSVRWVAECKWTYTLHLDRSKLPEGDTLWVVFEGLAGVADVVFYDDIANAQQFSSFSTDNMFIEYRFPLPSYANDIMVQFYPLFDSAREAEYGIPLPDRRAFTRIAPYQQGWDWGPKLPTCGIWKPAYVVNSKDSRQSRDSRASRDSRDSRQSSASSSSSVTLLQTTDSIGQSFTFYRDGKPVFAKGANWIPVHSFPVLDSANRARYRHLLCSAKEAGFNMLRVWGGGIYEHDYFFDLCDSLGIMVWMDFNFSTMLYPDDPKMLESIREEAYQNVTRIAKHPCVVLWCGNNEVKNGWEDWGWQGVYNWSPEQRARLEKAMDTIFGYSRDSRQSRASISSRSSSSTSILSLAVRDCDPLHRPYITTSPLFGWGHPECVTHGDSHYWGVWWGEEPFEKYAEKTGRFMSEFGFQSYPMMSTICKYAPEVNKKEWKTKSFHDAVEAIPALRSHQKHPRGLQIIDKAMMQYYGFDSHTLPLEDYVYVSQLLQAWGTGYGIFQHIKQQPHCMGTLYWQFNDCWPVASWSSVDYYGNWKALHYRVQALYEAENGERRTENGERRAENGERRTENLKKWEDYYSVYPKDRHYDKPLFHYSTEIKDGSLIVHFQALSSLYDVFVDTEPHIDGHFSGNFFDLKEGEKKTVTFVPVDPKASIKDVKVTVRTLNELYQ